MAFAVNYTARFRTLVILFVCAAVYALFSMTIFRELIIPSMLPSSEGNISGDSQYYHQLALSKVGEMQDKGVHFLRLKDIKFQINDIEQDCGNE